MKKFITSNIWIFGAILFPLSWVTYSGPNLSFLAWIAFIPLFIYLEQHSSNFKKFYGASLAMITPWALITSAWVFHFPIPKWQVALIIFSETLHISLPFAVLYLLQRKLGFTKALFLLPFLWVAWEWLYIQLEHTMGSHLLAYAQGNNLWLIQMGDLGGMWIVSFWVMMFNVSLYLSTRSIDFHLHSKRLATSILRASTLMIAFPLLYSAFAFQNHEIENDSSIQVSIVPTQFNSEYLMNANNQKKIIESTLHRTDSLAYELTKKDKGSDLYVWPEAGTSYWMAFDNLTSILHEATTDWAGSLLTGCQGVPMDGSETEAYISGVLISPIYDSTITPLQYHHKTSLVPGAEHVPYFDQSFSSDSHSNNTFKVTSHGKSYKPLEVTTKENQKFQAGISLCYEQWFPSAWTKQANNGAEFFVHMAGEGWYGEIGFAQFMANVSRFRAVENRRSVVRSSNKGLSMFINSQGKTQHEIAYGSLEMATTRVATSNQKTLFSQYPNAFPVFCLCIGLIGFMSSRISP